MSLANIIPGDWRRWATTQPAVIRQLLGGLTNHSYLINADNTLLVLRKNSAISGALNLNRKAETQALNHANKARLCAPLVYTDPQQQYMVSCYLGDSTWSANTPNSLAQLALLLRSIHQLPSIQAKLNLDDKIAYYLAAMLDHAEFTEQFNILRTKIQPHISSAMTLNTGDVLCHNDLLASNLINKAGELFAIDWEYAAMGDPFYELAVIIEGNKLDADQQQALLTKYLDRPLAQRDWQRLHHWKIIYGYLCVLWYGVQYCAGAMNQASTAREIAAQIRALNAFISNETQSKRK
ncbi:hypothetical protein GCM10022414_11540 [Zhongshania borealis]|uniref:Aminoglycoside phosphotransferase domain-containing protein n=2 Tax=Zhongshania borealis TaxID=889488 RepID=A0ABP7WJ46_9GAMM